jgi:hypothetical protein
MGFAKDFSYTLVWFIGKSEECFPRNPFLSSISYRKRSKRRDLFFSYASKFLYFSYDAKRAFPSQFMFSIPVGFQRRDCSNVFRGKELIGVITSTLQ